MINALFSWKLLVWLSLPITVELLHQEHSNGIIENSHEITIENRPYTTINNPLVEYHRNEIGEWFGYIVGTHAVFAILMISSLSFPVFFTTKGSKFHKITGVITIIFWIGFIIFGDVAARSILIHRD